MARFPQGQEQERPNDLLQKIRNRDYGPAIVDQYVASCCQVDKMAIRRAKVSQIEPTVARGSKVGSGLTKY
jgi:hypothetical protein